MNEAESRAEHIDPALKAAGWGVVEGRPAFCQDLLPDPYRRFGSIKELFGYFPGS